MAQQLSSPTFNFSGLSPNAAGTPQASSPGHSPKQPDAGLDDLAAALAGSFQVSSDPNTPNAPHPRFSQYKMRYSNMDQHERRRRQLRLQKEKRFDVQNHVRRLTSNIWDDVPDEVEEEEEIVSSTQEAPMDTTPARLRKPGKHYKNQLMFSEWMLEVPDDFEEEWLMVPCPVGKRNLVIATGGETKMYTKNGYNMKTFPSALPGGNRKQSSWSSDSTILDCIYSEVTNTFYILDMMNWKKHPLYDSETEFRMYWMQTQFAENPEMKIKTKANPFLFEPLPNFSCAKDNIQKVMSITMNLELDGLLFYHKKTHYTFGSTPLVLWLKAYMLPEIIGIPVPSIHFKNVPSDYQGFNQHVAKVKRDKELLEQQRAMEQAAKDKQRVITPKGKKKSPGKSGGESSAVKTPPAASNSMQTDQQQPAAPGSSGKKKKKKKRGSGQGAQSMDTAEAQQTLPTQTQRPAPGGYPRPIQKSAEYQPQRILQRGQQL